MFGGAAAVRVARPPRATVSSLLFPVTSERGPMDAVLAKLPAAFAEGAGARRADPIQALLPTRELEAAAAARIRPDDGRVRAHPFRELGFRLDVGEGNGGSIRIAVTGRDAEGAAEANQAVLDALDGMLSGRTLTDAKRQRLYAEKLLGENASRKRSLEEALMGFGADTSVVMDPPLEALLARVSALRERAAGKRIAADALASVSTNGAAAVKPLLDEMASLQAEASRVAGTATFATGGTVVVPVARVPLVALQYRRLQGELAILDQIDAMLRSQHEMALLQEARDAPTFTVIDPPLAAAAVIEPSLRQFVTLAVFAALFAGVGAAYFAEWWAAAGPTILGAVRGSGEAGGPTTNPDADPAFARRDELAERASRS